MSIVDDIDRLRRRLELLAKYPHRKSELPSRVEDLAAFNRIVSALSQQPEDHDNG